MLHLRSPAAFRLATGSIARLAIVARVVPLQAKVPLSTALTGAANARKPMVAPLRAARTLASAHTADMHKSTPRLEQLRSNDWISPEAERLTLLAYNEHRELSEDHIFGPRAPQRPSSAELEKLGTPFHYPPKTFGDRVALKMVRALNPLVHWFFRDKYVHHAVVLETVAAVPGMVAAVLRHFRSLRRMDRDHGWILPLFEEANNERAHLLTFMYVCQPTLLEKMLVMAAQGVYASLYASMYVVAPGTAHRFVGYLEEHAVDAYTMLLQSIDSGKTPNVPAPAFARKYWRLPADATLRDVVLHVRADECMHRTFNHHLGDRVRAGLKDAHPNYHVEAHERYEKYQKKTSA